MVFLAGLTESTSIIADKIMKIASKENLFDSEALIFT